MHSQQALTRAQCLQFLALGRRGRIAFTERALPAIRRVDYALVGTDLAFRMDTEALGHLVDGQVVAFAVDETDDDGRGWGVHLTGTARLLPPPGELVQHDAIRLAARTGRGGEGIVCLAPGPITGWRITQESART